MIYIGAKRGMNKCIHEKKVVIKIERGEKNTSSLKKWNGFVFVIQNNKNNIKYQLNIKYSKNCTSKNLKIKNS